MRQIKSDVIPPNYTNSHYTYYNYDYANYLAPALSMKMPQRSRPNAFAMANTAPVTFRNCSG